MKNMKITTAMLAQICEVSQGTVDRALNNRSDINIKTKERILKTARLYGYRDTVADEHESLKQVGIIVFDLKNDCFSELVTEVESNFKSRGYCTVTMISHKDKKRELDCIKKLYAVGVEGIVVCPVNRDKNFKRFLGLFNIPIVTVDLENRELTEKYEGTVKLENSSVADIANAAANIINRSIDARSR